MDPGAANYNPSATSDDGTCTFVVPEAAAEEELSGDLHTFITSALSSLWGAPGTPTSACRTCMDTPMQAWCSGACTVCCGSTQHLVLLLRAGSNFERSGESDKAADFKKLGLTGYSGDKVVSQRDIQRLVRQHATPLLVSVHSRAWAEECHWRNSSCCWC